MKKILLVMIISVILALSVAPVTVAYAGMNNVVIQFTTVGPDKYADGETVMDGETYALVWTPDGQTFGGINVDGTAVGPSKVAANVPFAKGGKCPNVQFQIDETFAEANYPNGTWGVYLLDTRKFATESYTTVVDGVQVVRERVLVDGKGKRTATGVGGNVNGYVKVDANVGRSLAPAGSKAGVVQSIPAGVQPPTIEDFKVINGMAYLFLKDTSSAVSYGVTAGQNPGTIAPVHQQPVTGGGSETIIVTPASGAGGFLTPVVKTIFSTGDVSIVITVASAFVVSTLILTVIKKKKVHTI